jgi:hypothetical protein
LRRRCARQHGGRVAAATRPSPESGTRSRPTVGRRLGPRPGLLRRGCELAAICGPQACGGSLRTWRPSPAGNPRAAPELAVVAVRLGIARCGPAAGLGMSEEGRRGRWLGEWLTSRGCSLSPTWVWTRCFGSARIHPGGVSPVILQLTQVGQFHPEGFQ